MSYNQKAPHQWTPLMSLMETSTQPLARRSRKEIHDLCRMVVDGTNLDYLQAQTGGTGDKGGGKTFVHMARDEFYLDTVLDRIEMNHHNARDICNIADFKGHTPYDIQWNKSKIRSVIKRFGGKMLKMTKGEINSRDGGWVAKDPDHHYHRHTYA